MITMLKTRGFSDGRPCDHACMATHCIRIKTTIMGTSSVGAVGLSDCQTYCRTVGLSEGLSDCRTRSRQWQTVRERVAVDLLSDHCRTTVGMTVGMTVGLSDTVGILSDTVGRTCRTVGPGLNGTGVALGTECQPKAGHWPSTGHSVPASGQTLATGVLIKSQSDPPFHTNFTLKLLPAHSESLSEAIISLKSLTRPIFMRHLSFSRFKFDFRWPLR